MEIGTVSLFLLILNFMGSTSDCFSAFYLQLMARQLVNFGVDARMVPGGSCQNFRLEACFFDLSDDLLQLLMGSR